MPPLTMGKQSAREALKAACSAAGVNADGAELIRLGENAVYRLATEPVVVRIARSVERLPDARREVAVARWLATAGIPAIEPINVRQPVVALDRVATFWVSASDAEEYGTTRQLGVILKELHQVDSLPDISLRAHNPFQKAYARLDQVTTLSGEDRRFLTERCSILESAYAVLEYELEPGVIHGDANVGNLILDRFGSALLADLDGFCIGPREWDLILTAMYFDRYGWHTGLEYADFVRAYDFDVRSWSGYQTMSDTRELLMVAWLAQNADQDGQARDELAKRISDLRENGNRSGWRPL